MNDPLFSVGVVEPKYFTDDTPLQLASGRTLASYSIIYETYGELNANKDNAVLICHALSGHHHAAGFHDEIGNNLGWWDHYIGPGKVIDTRKFFVVSPHNIGGCFGSSGPNTINPSTNQPWGKDFPRLRVRDWVNTQERLANYLGIDCWAAVVGGSLGGMQAMRWALEYPERLKHSVVIASAMKLTAQNLAFNELARQAIQSDANFKDGDYLAQDTQPSSGLALARMIAHVTYLSDDAMGQKFGRNLKTGSFALGQEDPVEFQVQSYLRYQGEKFVGNFDANSYVLITEILDYFDLAREYGDDAVAAFASATCKFLIVSFESDWRFAKERSREIRDALVGANKSVTYAEVDSTIGHDAFLLPNKRYEKLFGAYMHNIETTRG